MIDIQNPEGGVLLVDKPLTWTSFDVVNKIRYTAKFKKVGHAGTLDPLATGLLIICFGKKTKTIDTYQAQIKEYTGTFLLGKTTPSFDLETEYDKEFDISHVTIADLDKAKELFLGEIEQVPPIFSAVKVKGRRAYDAARAGEDIKLKPRSIRIDEFEIDASNLPEVKFRIVCSKGTYIRSIARDFGLAVGAGATLTELRRTKIGDFSVDNSYNMEDLIKELQISRESIS